METRKVLEHICLSELPFVMRAIGFYPSEGEVGRRKTSAGSVTNIRSMFKEQPVGLIEFNLQDK